MWPDQHVLQWTTRDPQRKVLLPFKRWLVVFMVSLWPCISMATDSNLQAINIHHIVYTRTPLQPTQQTLSTQQQLTCECWLCVCVWGDSFTNTHSVSWQCVNIGAITLLSYRLRIWGIEKLRDVLEVTHLENGRAGIQTQEDRVQRLTASP